ncbi:hypothetical protein CRG98_018346 [Punica granatum]|uniref:Uncharacterized protein n=1 Tax=Punica granatum TaxID=22663 RepID=A0A2I0JYF7_PUNGR|nr:hypothetical protein CRG98_018346 [Punica granatum]
MTFMERDRARSVQGAHMMLARWDKGLALEEVTFDSVTFWIQIRDIPSELLSKGNIAKLTGRAGEVLEIDWKDMPSLSKCLLGHDQAHCSSESPAPPNLYGPWLRFDNQNDLPPPPFTAPSSPPSPSPPPQSPELKSTSTICHKSPSPQKLGFNVNLNQLDSDAYLPDDSDNDSTRPSQTASGIYAARKLLTVVDPKGKEVDCANSPDSSFLGWP